MSLANRVKAIGRTGSNQSFRLRASHGSGLGLRVSHRRTRDWRPPDKDVSAEWEHGGRPDLFTGDRKRRRKKKRRKGR